MKTNSTNCPALLMLLAAIMYTGCEKPIIDKEAPTTNGNITIRASLYDIAPFGTRAAVDIASYSTSISYVFYQDGAQTKKITQKSGDNGYGSTTTTLAAGEYQLLVLAHSCPLGNPTMTNPSAIQFTNTGTGYSDVFYYYGPITVTDEAATYDLGLQRATSLLRIKATDKVPQQVRSIRVLYKGESGVFNAVTGWGGTVNSEQRVTINIDNPETPLVLDAYTFLREETGELKTVTITALDAAGATVTEKQLKNVPMKSHMVTEYEGPLFGESEVSGVTLRLTADTEWDVYEKVTFQ